MPLLALWFGPAPFQSPAVLSHLTQLFASFVAPTAPITSPPTPPLQEARDQEDQASDEDAQEPPTPSSHSRSKASTNSYPFRDFHEAYLAVVQATIDADVENETSKASKSPELIEPCTVAFCEDPCRRRAELLSLQPDCLAKLIRELPPPPVAQEPPSDNEEGDEQEQDIQSDGDTGIITEAGLGVESEDEQEHGIHSGGNFKAETGDGVDGAGDTNGHPEMEMQSETDMGREASQEKSSVVPEAVDGHQEQDEEMTFASADNLHPSGSNANQDAAHGALLEHPSETGRRQKTPMRSPCSVPIMDIQTGPSSFTPDHEPPASLAFPSPALGPPGCERHSSKLHSSPTSPTPSPRNAKRPRLSEANVNGVMEENDKHVSPPDHMVW